MDIKIVNNPALFFLIVREKRCAIRNQSLKDLYDHQMIVPISYERLEMGKPKDGYKMSSQWDYASENNDAIVEEAGEPD